MKDFVAYCVVFFIVLGLVQSIFGQSDCSVVNFMSQDQDLLKYAEFVSILKRATKLNKTEESYLTKGYDGLLLVPTNEVATRYYTQLNDTDLVKVISMHIIPDSLNVNTIGPREVTLSGTTLYLNQNLFVENEDGDISTIDVTYSKILPCEKQIEFWILEMMVIPPGMMLPQPIPIISRSSAQDIGLKVSPSQFSPFPDVIAMDQYNQESIARSSQQSPLPLSPPFINYQGISRSAINGSDLLPLLAVDNTGLGRSSSAFSQSVRIPSNDEITSQSGQYKLPFSQWRVEYFQDGVHLVDEKSEQRIKVVDENQKICDYDWIIHVVEGYFGL
eukprot:TRINITY_DN7283_c0_g1_i12.p1 TRINITY_DN7283_c0_g1~~TRINITY_DN7283_c0_g1_i12.p1  ORF type:complete len:331 (-),score=31.28 TRINITY_DN7283_c0_g1_i12:80-1072(-)